jgi:hypothetical protein
MGSTKCIFLIIDEKGEWDGEFKQHILKYGIKPILAGVKHPTPEQAFWRKLPMEVIFGIGNRLFGL